jgi:Na+/H+-dicarboxylate symporter
MSFTVRVLLALVAGFLLGIGVSMSATPWVQQIPALVEPIGLLFVNGIRMTVIPLVVASLIAGVASMRNAQAVGRLGGRALAWFLVALGAATLFGAACAYPLLARLQIDPAVAASLRASAAGTGKAAADTAMQLPSLSQWLIDLVPVNVFKAASDGNILPLTVFALAFGLALTGVAATRREALLGVLRAVADGMLVLVTWVLKLTPLGVFALAVPLAARMGLAAAGALVYYVALLSAISAAFVVLLYPAAAFVGRVPIARFAKAAAPAQAVGFTSRSSLAALPACIEAARTDLRLPDEIASFFLPLAASMFRVGGAIAQVVGVLFVARLYGVSLNPAQVGTVILAVIPASLTIPGIPGGAIITVSPVLASVGLPAEGIGILLGVDTISDMFRTMANVTGWLAVGTILGRRRLT